MNVIPLYPKPPPEPKCSFCNKPKSKVKALMSNGHDKYICNVCINKAKELLND